MKKLLADLRERKIGQTAILYLGTGWVIIEAVNFFIEKFQLGNLWFNIIFLLALFGFPTALLISWFHGKSGYQKIAPLEILLYIFLLAGATVSIWYTVAFDNSRTYRSSTSGDKSIAVLPFHNLNKDAENEFISDGITEDIISKLSQVSDFKVISRTSSFYYKNNSLTVPEIGKELRVASILAGSVRRVGNQLRITAELVNVMTDETLWVQSFDRDVTELFAIQSEVAEQIAKALQLKLSKDEKERVYKNSDFNLSVYEHYQHGLTLLRGGGTQVELDSAVYNFTKAVELDPTFSPAYVGLANTYLDFDGWGRLPLHEVVPKARAAALKALELNESIGEAYDILAACAFNYDWDKAKFLNYIEKAISLTPNFYRPYVLYSTYYSLLGDTAASMRYLNKAIELDPMATRNLVSPVFNYTLSGAHQKAIQYSLRQLKKYPGNNFILFGLGQAYSCAGQNDKAIEVLQQRSAGTYTNWCLGYAYGKVGRKAEAEKVLLYLLEKSKSQYVPSIIIGYVYLGLGNQEKAIDYFEDTVYSKSSGFDWLVILLQDNRLDEIRQHPRFLKLRATIPF